MSRVGWGVILLVVIGSGIAGAAVVAADDRPLAEAGLDQTVSQGATVYLDAGGSVAPDGSIVGYNWQIERPNGTVDGPACHACERTRFVPEEVGTYAVSVTVTGETGQTDTDTMYVTVLQVVGPDADVDGPDRLAVGEEGQVELDATAGDRRLDTYALGRSGESSPNDAGDATTWTRSVAFDNPGEYVVTGVVTDSVGNRAVSEHTIEVYSSDGPDDGDDDDNEGGDENNGDQESGEDGDDGDDGTDENQGDDGTDDDDGDRKDDDGSRDRNDREGHVSVDTDPASDIDTRSVTLHGLVTELEHAEDVTLTFEYGEKGTELSTTVDSGTTSTVGSFDAPVDGLASGTEYAFRAVAETANDSDAGEVLTFTTPERDTEPDGCSVSLSVQDTETVTHDSTLDDRSGSAADAVRATVSVRHPGCENVDLVLRGDGPGDESFEQELITESHRRSHETQFTFEDLSAGDNFLYFSVVADPRDSPETLEQLSTAVHLDRVGHSSPGAEVELLEENPTDEPSMEAVYKVDLDEGGTVSFPGSDTETRFLNPGSQIIKVTYYKTGDVQVEATVSGETEGTEVFQFTLTPDCADACDRHLFEAVEYATGDWVDTGETRDQQPETSKPGVRWEKETTETRRGHEIVPESPTRRSQLEAHEKYQQVDTRMVETGGTKIIVSWEYPYEYEADQVERLSLVNRTYTSVWERSVTETKTGQMWTDFDGREKCSDGEPFPGAVPTGETCTYTYQGTETKRGDDRPSGSGWEQVDEAVDERQYEYRVPAADEIERPVFDYVDIETVWHRSEIRGETHYHHQDPGLAEPYRIVSDFVQLDCNDAEHVGEPYHEESCVRSGFWGEWVTKDHAK
ncbi:MAG: PKD domain-containing protein [Halovenus sp.]